MPFDGLADRIGTGKDLPLLVPDRHMATDPFELPDHHLRLHAGSKGEGDETADRLGLRGGTASCFPYLIEDLEEISLLILVDGNIKIPTPRPDLPGDPRITSSRSFGLFSPSGTTSLYSSFSWVEERTPL
jgi:hypothetical protein